MTASNITKPSYQGDEESLTLLAAPAGSNSNPKASAFVKLLFAVIGAAALAIAYTAGAHSTGQAAVTSLQVLQPPRGGLIECTKGASITCLKSTASKEHKSVQSEVKEVVSGGSFDKTICDCLANVDTSSCSAEVASAYASGVNQKCRPPEAEKKADGYGMDFDFSIFGMGTSSFSLMM